MKMKTLMKSLGPGLMWAAAAIGVSHLVQSTRAGASYGFQLLWLIFVINLFKYPFFEFGPRYAAATGETLLRGYQRLGKWAVYVYAILTFGTMFAIQSAVTIVTAGLFTNVFGIMDIYGWTVILLLVSVIIIVVGRYSLLDKMIKFIIIILTVATVIAVVSAFFKGFNPNPEFIKSFNWEFTDVAFLIAFAGWMPSAIDISVWHSFWTVARKEETGYAPKVKEALFDFNVGFIGTAFLSVGFLALGAIVMYGSGEEFASSGTAFAGQLINLYTSTIGSWAYILISIAALTTMFSTTLTCLDAYPRVLNPLTMMIITRLKTKKRKQFIHFFWIATMVIVSYIIIRFYASSMKVLVDFATTLSFLTAPVLGYMNLKVVMGKNVPESDRPKPWLRVLSWIGLVALSGFGAWFLIWRFFL
jgi:Mn2+/Fe2+ NRAMP family transporter